MAITGRLAEGVRGRTIGKWISVPVVSTPQIGIAVDDSMERKRVSLFQLMQQYAGPARRLDDLRRRSGAAELRRSRAAAGSLAGFRHPGGRGPRGAPANPPF